MGTLIEQINELISVLEIVDPEAAAALRGGLTPEKVNFGSQTPVRANTKVSRPAITVTNTESTQAGNLSDASLRDSITNPLHMNIKRDNLMQGIIYSEILGKPVSRRHRYRG